jgi:hypothetical protein
MSSAPTAKLADFVIVTTSDLGTVNFTYDATGMLVADNGLGLPMPDSLYEPPSFTVDIQNMPTEWETLDIGTFDIRYGCEHSMTFWSTTTNGNT